MLLEVVWGSSEVVVARGRVGGGCVGVVEASEY